LTALPPNRSTSSPTGIKQTMYIHKKDENKYPISTGVSPNSTETGLAATDNATRSV
jgi:hypothetical protein